MDELVKDEAKLHISNGIEKASGAQGVDIKVRQKSPHFFAFSQWSLTETVIYCLRLHAKLSKNRWTDSMGTHSTAWWVRDSLSRWLDRQTKVCTCIIQANWPFYSLNAEQFGHWLSCWLVLSSCDQFLERVIWYVWRMVCFGRGFLERTNIVTELW